MSIFEYDKEEEERKLREAEREVGREEGWKEGEAAGRASGLRDGELRKAYEVAKALFAEAMPIEKIAQIVGMEETIIREWIAEK